LIKNAENNLNSNLFKFIANTAFSAVDFNIHTSQIYQNQVVNYFLTRNGSVSRWEYGNFTTSSEFWDVPAMLAIQFDLCITDEEISEIKALALQETGEEFWIKPKVFATIEEEVTTGSHCIIHYNEPFADNKYVTQF
jgi:hypothetical protein